MYECRNKEVGWGLGGREITIILVVVNRIYNAVISSDFGVSIH